MLALLAQRHPLPPGRTAQPLYEGGTPVLGGRGLLFWFNSDWYRIRDPAPGETPTRSRVFLAIADDAGDIAFDLLWESPDLRERLDTLRTVSESSGATWVALWGSGNGTSLLPTVNLRLEGRVVTHRLEGAGLSLCVDPADRVWTATPGWSHTGILRIIQQHGNVASIHLPAFDTRDWASNPHHSPTIFPDTSPGRVWVWTDAGLQEVLAPDPDPNSGGGGDGDAEAVDDGFRIGKTYRLSGIRGTVQEVRPLPPPRRPPHAGPRLPEPRLRRRRRRLRRAPAADHKAMNRYTPRGSIRSANTFTPRWHGILNDDIDRS